MFKTIAGLIIVYFFAREFVPTIAGILGGVIYYVVNRHHDREFYDNDDRHQEYLARKKSQKENGNKGPIGFRSDRIDS